jgi:hypothetical protein
VSEDEPPPDCVPVTRGDGDEAATEAANAPASGESATGLTALTGSANRRVRDGASSARPPAATWTCLALRTLARLV